MTSYVNRMLLAKVEEDRVIDEEEVNTKGDIENNNSRRGPRGHGGKAGSSRQESGSTGETCPSTKLDSGIDSFNSIDSESITGDSCANVSANIRRQFQELSLAEKAAPLPEADHTYGSADHTSGHAAARSESFDVVDQGFDEGELDDTDGEVPVSDTGQYSGHCLTCRGVEPLSLHDLFEQDEDGDTQLHIAVIQMLSEVVFAIVNWAPRPAFLDMFNDMHQTALHLAVLTNQHSIVKHLVRSGASLTVRDRLGNTPLHLASKTGNIQCIKQLTKGNRNQKDCLKSVIENINSYNYDGHTCLHIAVISGNTAVVQYLLDHGGDANAQDATSGRTLLHHAVEMNNLRLVEMLSTWRGVDVTQATWYSPSTAHDMAIDRGFNEIANTLRAVAPETMSDDLPDTD